MPKCFYIPGSHHSFHFCNRKIIATCVYCERVMCKGHIPKHNCGNGSVFEPRRGVTQIMFLDKGQYA